MLDRLTIHSGSTAAIYQEWSKLIAQIYLGRYRLIRGTGSLPSIAGIASLFSKMLNDDYAAGIWENSMHQSLCWASLKRKGPRCRNLLKRLKIPSPYIAPSRSWASQRTAFFFKLYHSNLSDDCRPEFHSIDTDIDLRGESAFGEVRDAALDITSKVLVGSPRLTWHEQPRRCRAQDTAGFNGEYFATIEPDWFGQYIFESTEGRTPATPISLLLIGS
ncbi:hypothetical protein FAGAP_6210 [Fusarium agapanthi]|uniref:Uncharacterized protein n=1 Tax=Fusarium agapanthi TaxID=1803897 RepID=A0A9P5B9J0_9HYPO|nr:hypothetical protein FAGAP_6210 [Fusarium agapanthi]